MKDIIITEFVNFKVSETITDDQLLSGSNIFINDFLKNQTGFMDAELIKSIEGNSWCLIIHYESFEKVKAVGEKMRNCKEFDEFKTLLVPGSISVTFFQMLKKW